MANTSNVLGFAAETVSGCIPPYSNVKWGLACSQMRDDKNRQHNGGGARVISGAAHEDTCDCTPMNDMQTHSTCFSPASRKGTGFTDNMNMHLWEKLNATQPLFILLFTPVLFLSSGVKMRKKKKTTALYFCFRHLLLLWPRGLHFVSAGRT